MKKPLILLAACTAVLLFAACNKSTPNPASYIIGKWQTEKTIRSFTVFGFTYRDSLFPSACQQDNYTAYELNGRGYISGGDTLCSGEAPVDSFQYLYSDLQKHIIQQRGFALDTLNVKTLTQDALVHTQTQSIDTFGISVGSYTETYLRKLP